MPLTVLNVAYPLAPVCESTAGGAEQVLARLDKALVEAGHRSLVLASEGSRVAGRLIPSFRPAPPFDEPAKAEAQRNCAALLRSVLRSEELDVIHMHGIDFHTYLPPPGVPVLVTLHLPLAWYPQPALRPCRPGTFLHCVSSTQHRAAKGAIALLPPIENGIHVHAFARDWRKRNFALFLGRICPEKGVHLAIGAARRAGIPLVLAGQVFPYDAHLRYFETHVQPQLGRSCRFVGQIGMKQKRRFLGMARCLLLPSLAEETSSLVAREALAAGTPVITFRRGALSEVVTDGKTGFLVRNEEEMAQAIWRVSKLDTEACRRDAKNRFDFGATFARYLRLYQQLSKANAPAGALA